MIPAQLLSRLASPAARQRFDTFWQAYPRKVGKQPALKVWLKLAPDDELFSAILEALKWQRVQPQWRKDGGQYVPHPVTWLRQGRWDDEPPPPRTVGPTFSELKARGWQ